MDTSSQRPKDGAERDRGWSVGLGRVRDREVLPNNPDIEFFARMDREVTPSNPDIDTSSQRPKDGAEADRGWRRPTGSVKFGRGRQVTGRE